MDTLLQDIRFAYRSLRRTPGFAVMVVLMMALGIAVNAVIYSVLRALLFRDLPFREPDRIVRIESTDVKRPGAGDSNMSLPDSRDIIERAPAAASVAVWLESSAYLTIGDEPQRYTATIASDQLAATLGVEPLLGRWFTPDEAHTGANLVPVVIGHRAWQEQFHGSPGVLDSTLTLNGRVRTIVGVMPEGFRFPEVSDYFLPLAMNDTSDSRGAHYLYVAARLAPGASLGELRQQLTALARDLARQYPATNTDMGFLATPMHEQMIGDIRPMLIVLALAVTFVLLIACANVANLLLVRATGRVRELGVRMSLGATRGRIVRQLLTESVLLALAGALCGLLLGHWGLRLLLAAIPIELPYWMRFEIDPAVMATVTGVSVLSGLVFGFAPAWHVTSGDLLTPLREGTPGGGDSPARRRLRDGLVVFEIALAVVLLVASGLMVRSFMRMQEQQNALRVEGVLTGSVTLPGAVYPDDAQRRAFFVKFRQSVAELPGVRSAGAAINLHLGNNRWTMNVMREGVDQPGDPRQPQMAFNAITPGYLDAVGLTLVRGRDFTESDGGPEGAAVALVNQRAAERLWPGEEAIGKRIQVSSRDPRWLTVVGVVADVSQNIHSSRERTAEVIVPHAEFPAQTLVWAVRTEGSTAALAPPVRQLLRSLDPNLPFYNMRTMREHVARAMWDTRLYAQMLGVFSVMALFIAALGIYGVMAYSVGQRTREIGIRMALGAARADVQRLVFGQATRLTALGMGLGLAAAFAVTRLMAGMLFGVRPHDPPTFFVVTVMLAASAIAAAWLPVARAVRVDPVVALRHE